MASRQLPSTMRKLVVTKISQKFRDVVKITQESLPNPGAGEVLVKNRFVGINASDINYTAGRYDTTVKPPFDCGFEAVGEVAAVGPGASLRIGQPVTYSQFGAFSEYKNISERNLLKLPRVSADYLPLQVSGATAAIALDKYGELKAGETVLVTAAAGGTGQFAVQWTKRAGCHVIGTCSTDDKVQFLRKIGCDRPVNYKKENLKTVLKTEYKNGVDVVYESIGGEMFETCLNGLKTKGRLLVIGYITDYESDQGFKPTRTLATIPIRLLTKSASIRGFFLNHFVRDWVPYVSKMADMIDKKELQSFIDMGENSPKGPFIGIDKIVDAVEYLYSQKSIGKIVVELNKPSTSKL
ncbi:prostaglandin reductase-3-like isoform X3 [Mytilus edulis]|uniref:prostaglandin reductase-3-like isoform X3 n=1 Tax=Mytilus edulis TaxID=6550 RepID=UPI0039F00C4A